MKLSDYVIEYLVSKNVKTVFLVAGGGIMHMLDSIGRIDSIEYICNLNEQAVGYAVEAYGQLTNKMGVGFVTTGPGGTNALSGVASAWTDSTPMLIISGQVKREDSAKSRKVRQYGLQEINIVDIVSPITKYAITVNEPDKILWHLEKAWHLASTGRKGPVWIDIPLDIQTSEVEPDRLINYSPPQGEKDDLTIDIKSFERLLSEAKRPLFFWGYGVIASNAQRDLVAQAERLNIPILTSWRAKSAIAYDHPLYFGHPGSPAHRSANFILQSSDLLIVIGSRLSPGVTAYNESGFGRNADRVVVDIDLSELEKINSPVALKIHSSAGDFASIISNVTAKPFSPDWLDFCTRIGTKYSLDHEYRTWDLGHTNPYVLIQRISSRMTSDDVFVGASSGFACAPSFLAFMQKSGQMIIGNAGMGAMGYPLPASIGACIASAKRRTIVTDGDGSLQMNVQELQVISARKLPIIIFVFNNGVYAQITSMQRRSFKGLYVGANMESGVSLPDLSLIAKAYDMKYFRIAETEEIDSTLDEVFSYKGPCLCDVIVPENIEEYPRALTHINADGMLYSDELENLWPYLTDDEISQSLMIE